MRFYPILFLLVLFAFASCEKEESFAPLEEQSADSEFFEHLSFVMENMNDDENFKLKVGEEEIVFDFSETTISTQSKGLSTVVGGGGNQAKERCRGDGIKFAKCTKKAVDDYGCQQVTKDGDEYVSNDC